jgi:hypothetical protein
MCKEKCPEGKGITWPQNLSTWMFTQHYSPDNSKYHYLQSIQLVTSYKYSTVFATPKYIAGNNFLTSVHNCHITLKVFK